MPLNPSYSPPSDPGPSNDDGRGWSTLPSADDLSHEAAVFELNAMPLNCCALVNSLDELRDGKTFAEMLIAIAKTSAQRAAARRLIAPDVRPVDRLNGVLDELEKRLLGLSRDALLDAWPPAAAKLRSPGAADAMHAGDARHLSVLARVLCTAVTKSGVDESSPSSVVPTSSAKRGGRLVAVRGERHFMAVMRAGPEDSVEAAGAAQKSTGATVPAPAASHLAAPVCRDAASALKQADAQTRGGDTTAAARVAAHAAARAAGAASASTAASERAELLATLERAFPARRLFTDPAWAVGYDAAAAAARAAAAGRSAGRRLSMTHATLPRPMASLFFWKDGSWADEDSGVKERRRRAANPRGEMDAPHTVHALVAAAAGADATWRPPRPISREEIVSWMRELALPLAPEEARSSWPAHDSAGSLARPPLHEMYATLSTTRDVLSGGGGGAVASNGATDQPRRASSAPTRRRTPFSSIYRPADVPAAFESGVLLCLMVERLRGDWLSTPATVQTVGRIPGIDLRPRSLAARVSNFEAALSALRQQGPLPRGDLRWSATALATGQAEVLWSLLTYLYATYALPRAEAPQTLRQRRAADRIDAAAALAAKRAAVTEGATSRAPPPPPPPPPSQLPSALRPPSTSRMSRMGSQATVRWACASDRSHSSTGAIDPATPPPPTDPNSPRRYTAEASSLTREGAAERVAAAGERLRLDARVAHLIPALLSARARPAAEAAADVEVSGAISELDALFKRGGEPVVLHVLSTLAAAIPDKLTDELAAGLGEIPEDSTEDKHHDEHAAASNFAAWLNALASAHASSLCAHLRAASMKQLEKAMGRAQPAALQQALHAARVAGVPLSLINAAVEHLTMLTAVVPPPTSLPASLPRTASDERLMLPASMRGISVQVAAEIAAPSWAIAAAEVTAEKAAEAALWETEAGRALVHTWLRRSFLIDVAEPAPLRRQAACPDAPDECLSLSPEQSPICNGTLLFEVATRLADPALRLAEEAAREGLAAGPRRRRPPYPKPRAPMHSEANLLAAVDELRRGVTGGRVVVPRAELVLLRRAVASVTAGDTQPVWRLLSWLRKFNPAPPAAAPPRRASRRAHHDASRRATHSQAATDEEAAEAAEATPHVRYLPNGEPEPARSAYPPLRGESPPADTSSSSGRRSPTEAHPEPHPEPRRRWREERDQRANHERRAGGRVVGALTEFKLMHWLHEALLIRTVHVPPTDRLSGGGYSAGGGGNGAGGAEGDGRRSSLPLTPGRSPLSPWTLHGPSGGASPFASPARPSSRGISPERGRDLVASPAGRTLARSSSLSPPRSAPLAALAPCSPRSPHSPHSPRSPGRASSSSPPRPGERSPARSVDGGGMSGRLRRALYSSRARAPPSSTLRLPTLDLIMPAVASGELLCDVAAYVSGAPILGIFRPPYTCATALSNIRKATRRLRDAALGGAAMPSHAEIGLEAELLHGDRAAALSWLLAARRIALHRARTAEPSTSAPPRPHSRPTSPKDGALASLEAWAKEPPPKEYSTTTSTTSLRPSSPGRGTDEARARAAVVRTLGQHATAGGGGSSAPASTGPEFNPLYYPTAVTLPDRPFRTDPVAGTGATAVGGEATVRQAHRSGRSAGLAADAADLSADAVNAAWIASRSVTLGSPPPPSSSTSWYLPATSQPPPPPQQPPPPPPPSVESPSAVARRAESMEAALAALASLSAEQRSEEAEEAEATAAQAAATMSKLEGLNLPRLGAWLRAVGVPEHATQLSVREPASLVPWRDGLQLVALVETLERRTLLGVERQPRSTAHCRRNVEKAMEALRLRKQMPITHLYSAPRVVRGEPTTILPLLAEIREAYGGEARAKRSLRWEPIPTTGGSHSQSMTGGSHSQS